jgi:hypothetical protein
LDADTLIARIDALCETIKRAETAKLRVTFNNDRANPVPIPVGEVRRFTLNQLILYKQTAEDELESLYPPDDSQTDNSQEQSE